MELSVTSYYFLKIFNICGVRITPHCAVVTQSKCLTVKFLFSGQTTSTFFVLRLRLSDSQQHSNQLKASVMKPNGSRLKKKKKNQLSFTVDGGSKTAGDGHANVSHE